MAAMLAIGLGFTWLALQPSATERRQQARAELIAIGEGEARAATAFGRIMAASRSQALTAEQAADRIEREVLPPWKQARRRAEAVRTGPLADLFPPELVEFFRLREQAWESLIAGVRQQDPTAIARHNQKWREADEIGARLRGKLLVEPN